jgi:hypothetical protein
LTTDTKGETFSGMAMFRRRRRKRPKGISTCARCGLPLESDKVSWCEACRADASRTTSLRKRAVELREAGCSWGYWHLRMLADNIDARQEPALADTARAPGGTCPLCSSYGLLLVARTACGGYLPVCYRCREI